MRKVVWVYWENPKGFASEPGYITLCRWTMLHHLQNSALVVVTPENLDLYLPGISKRLRSVEAFAFGRMHKLQRLFKGDRRSLAVKCDVIRAELLKKYGGIYVDSDALFFGDVDQYHALLLEQPFFIVKRESHGRSNVSINFYGSRPDSEVICEYTREQQKLLDEQQSFDFTGLGDVVLNPIADKYSDQIRFIPEREVHRITWEEADTAFLDTKIPVDDVLDDRYPVFMLFNAVFSEHLRDWSIEELYTSDILLSKLFRRALPEPVYAKNISKYS